MISSQAAPSGSAAPLSHDADPGTERGRTGVLVLHGFTGNPASMRPWAQKMIDEGFTVRLPLLPGHGTRWQDLNRTTFADWLGAATSSLQELTESCERVFVFGLSMGGTLALRLAELRPAAVSGLVLVNPSVLSLRKELRLVPILKHLLPSLRAIGDDIAKPGVSEHAYTRTPLRAIDSLRRAWPVVRGDLGAVTAPLLLFRSAGDHVVEPQSAAAILAEVSATDVTEVVLANSYHVATLDNDAEQIFDGSVAFVDRISATLRAQP